MGSIFGTLGGCLIIAILNNGMSLMGAQYHVQIFVKGMVIILAVLMDNAFKSRR
jgi:ribose transport system permease protein